MKSLAGIVGGLWALVAGGQVIASASMPCHRMPEHLANIPDAQSTPWQAAGAVLTFVFPIYGLPLLRHAIKTHS